MRGLVFRFPILGIVDSQTKNQGARRNIGQRDESEAGRRRVGSVIQKTDTYGPANPPSCEIEVMSPKVAAAADSLRIIVGIAQKAG